MGAIQLFGKRDGKSGNAKRKDGAIGMWDERSRDRERVIQRGPQGTKGDRERR